jgi:heme oxygenase (mycobilin-producing)
MTSESPAPLFRVFLRLRTRPGAGPAFERAWQPGADLIAGQTGNLGQWLARSTEDPDTYYVVSDWADEAGFRSYERSTVHAEHRARLRPHRADGEMWTMSVVRSVPGGTPVPAGHPGRQEASCGYGC